MIGIFDSGVGGLTALREVRRLLPTADICYLADLKNSPYGTKSNSELVTLAETNVSRLLDLGARHVLMACSTASTVYPLLSKECRDVAYPIIAPTAKRAARLTKNKRIGVIATERTVLSHAFKNEIEFISPDAYVCEIQTQNLVALIESGECDGYASRRAKKEVKKALEPILSEGVDTLILGCTHFPHLEKTIRNSIGDINIVSCSKEGAQNMCKTVFEEGKAKTEFIF